MKGSIIILQFKDVKKALSRIGGKPFAWLFLGQDIKLTTEWFMKLQHKH